jgi:hypothetical protein
MTDAPATEPDDSPQAEGSTRLDSNSRVLAWASLVCGALSLLTLPLNGGIPGSGIVAIVIGILVIRRPEVSPKYRRIAKIGLGLGCANCILWVGLVAWVILAFAMNPVAH